MQENLVVASQPLNAKLPKELKEQEQKGYDLLALHDGTIESIYVRKGTPLVEQGDLVKKETSSYRARCRSMMTAAR